MQDELLRRKFEVKLMKKTNKILSIVFVIFAIMMGGFALFDTEERTYQTKQDLDNVMEHVKNIAKESHSVISYEGHKKTIDYIIDTLKSFNLVNGDTTVEPAYLVQNFESNRSDVEDKYEQIHNLSNIIVHIPGNGSHKTNEAILFMAHHDSVAMGPGASDDSIACGAMLETINYYLQKLKNGYVLNNDLTFVFADGEEFGLLGSYAFINEFTQFDNLVERIKFGVNLESRGTSGTLIMFETSKNNYEAVKMFSKINENIFTSSIANMVYASMPNGTDYSSFKELYQGLNLANLGGGEDYHGQNDNIQNASTVYASQQLIIMANLIDYLGSYDLDMLDSKEDGVFFSYLNITTVIYTNTVAIIVSIITLILLITNVVLGIVLKKNQIIKTLKGFVVLLVALVGSAFATLICYYFFSLLASLFGVIDIHMIGTITYSSIWIIIGIILLAIFVSALSCLFLNKLLKIDGYDVVRALGYTYAFLGVVISFFIAEASYLLVYTGLLMMIIEILITTLSDKYNIKGLNLHFIVLGLTFPIIIPVIVLVMSALGMTMSYVYGLLASLLIMIVLPLVIDYFKYLSIPYYIKKLSKKVDLKRNPLTGTLTLLLLTMVILGISTLSPSHPSKNLQGKQNLDCFPYDDALVLNNDNGKQNLEIYDLNAYPFLNDYLNSYHYNKDKECYQKEVDINLDLTIQAKLEDNELTFAKNDKYSYVYVHINNNSNIKKVTAVANGQTMEYTLNIGKDSQILFYSDAVLSFETIDNEKIEANIVVKELFVNYQPLLSIHEDFSLITKNKYLKYNLWLIKNVN